MHLLYSLKKELVEFLQPKGTGLSPIVGPTNIKYFVSYLPSAIFFTVFKQPSQHCLVSQLTNIASRLTNPKRVIHPPPPPLSYYFQLVSAWTHIYLPNRNVRKDDGSNCCRSTVLWRYISNQIPLLQWETFLSWEDKDGDLHKILWCEGVESDQAWWSSTCPCKQRWKEIGWWTSINGKHSNFGGLHWWTNRSNLNQLKGKKCFVQCYRW